MRVVLTGGGSGGPVAPLLALAERIKEVKPRTEFLFIGTQRGLPEKEMINGYNFIFKSIYAGKLRRYFSWQNFLDTFRFKIGFFQSLFIIKKFKPDLIIGAGGYVSVPVVLAGWFLRCRLFVIQQDILPTLSNKILAPFVQKIFISFKPSLKKFPKKKTTFVSHPIRQMIFESNKGRAQETFKLKKEKPVLLILGGGTGATSLNNLIWQSLEEVTKFFQVVHLTGKDKLKSKDWQPGIREDYHAYEFLTKEIPDLFALADFIISRAGINVLAELAVLGKPTIVIPIPDSHQEANAQYFQEKNAALVLSQKKLTSEKLVNEIKKLINNKEKQNQLSENIKKIVLRDAAEKITSEIIRTISMY